MHALAYVSDLADGGIHRIGDRRQFVPYRRLCAETTFGHFVRVVVLMFAGPSEMFECAIAARISGQWTALGFWLSIAGVCYWSLILGLVVIHGAKDLWRRSRASRLDR